MEMHLSILDGVAERYETPFFDNLKKYAQQADRHLPRAADRARQVDLQVELDPRHGRVLRGQPVPRRVVGDHRRARQPARADRQHQEGAGRGRARLRRRPRVLRHQRHLDLQQDGRSRRCSQPGDIVIVDRNCHKSHHYGMVLAGAQPLLRRGLPDGRSTRCTARCRCARSRRRCSTSRPRAGSTRVQDGRR